MALAAGGVRGVVDYLNRAPARVIAFDFGFCEPDRHAQHRDRRSRVPARNPMPPSPRPWRVLRARCCSQTRSTKVSRARAPLRTQPSDWRQQSQPFRLGPAIEHARHRRSAVSPAHESRRRCSGTISCRSISMARRGGCRHSSARAIDTCRRLALPRRFWRGGFKPQEVVLEGNHIRIRDRRHAAGARTSSTPTDGRARLRSSPP